MKKMFIAAALIVSGLLSGCNQLTQYSVSEQEINQALQKRNHFGYWPARRSGCPY
jgi:outer membrane murein-binding lipoprotein Lpp